MSDPVLAIAQKMYEKYFINENECIACMLTSDAKETNWSCNNRAGKDGKVE